MPFTQNTELSLRNKTTTKGFSEPNQEQLIPPISPERAEAAIRKRFPELKIDSIQYLGGGSHSAFLVSNEYFIRFPKLIPGVNVQLKLRRMFEREKKLLPAIQEHVGPFLIPSQLFLSLKPDAFFPGPVAGYEAVGGDQVRVILKENPERKAEMAKLAGEFLSRLHTLRADDIGMALDQVPTRSEYENRWQNELVNIRERFFPKFTREERQWTEKIFDDFFTALEQGPLDITFVHGDFSAGNVLFDDEHNSFAAVDFDNAEFSDPAIDFINWLSEYDRKMLDMVVSSYELPIGDHFLQRIQFYNSRVPFIYFDLAWRTGNDAFWDFGKKMMDEKIKTS